MSNLRSFPTLESAIRETYRMPWLPEERIASGTGLPLGDTDGVIVVKEDQTVTKLQQVAGLSLSRV